MAKVHFKKTTTDSFFGNFLYVQIIPRNHFLVKLKEEIPWPEFLPQLLPYYKGGGEFGNSAYDPIILLKMLFLSYLYNLSERQVEEFTNFNLPAKFFVGLGADQAAPDHATLSVFRDRLIKGAGLLPYEQIFTKIVRLALTKDIQFGDIQVVDSSHIPANVNLIKEKTRQKEGKPPRDKDAAWGVKREKEAHTKEGKKVKVKEEFFGFKAHTSLNAETGLTTSVKVTSGAAYDGQFFKPLAEKDKRAGVKAKVYTADKAYDDGENHLYLENEKLGDAIRLKANRTTTKSETNNRFWQALKEKKEYQVGLKARYQVERSYADGKEKHTLRRCRFLGLVKFGIQVYLAFAAMNLKKIIKLTTNTSFRNGTYVYTYTYS